MANRLLESTRLDVRSVRRPELFRALAISPGNNRHTMRLPVVSGESASTPIALQKNQGEALWFVASLAIIKASGETTSGRVAVFEVLTPEGAGPPLHVHRREDEWFYVLEGELTFWVGGRIIEASPGAFIYGPRDVPHTYIVRSTQARYLGVAEPAGFENFMRAVSRPAEALTIPPPSIDLPDHDRLATVATEFGIEILGPPGMPGSS